GEPDHQDQPDRDVPPAPHGPSAAAPDPAAGEEQADERPAGQRAARAAAHLAADRAAGLGLAGGAVALGRRVALDLDVEQVLQRLDAGVEVALVVDVLPVAEQRPVLGLAGGL